MIRLFLPIRNNVNWTRWTELDSHDEDEPEGVDEDDEVDTDTKENRVSTDPILYMYHRTQIPAYLPIDGGDIGQGNGRSRSAVGNVSFTIIHSSLAHRGLQSESEILEASRASPPPFFPSLWN